MSITVDKPIDLPLLLTEIQAAGVEIDDLGTAGDRLVTYDGEGQTVDLDDERIVPVLAAHTAPRPLIDFVGQQTINRRHRTTNATPAELYRATLAPLTGYRAALNLLAVDAGNGALRMIQASIVAKRLNNGAALVGAPVVIANHQDVAASAWGIAATVDGNDFVITVTGAASRSIDWLLTGDVVSFTPGGN